MTGKRERFIAEYLVDMNCTQAARRAGYSEKTAYSIGQELLKNPEIQEGINTAMKEREKRTEITGDYVLQRLREVVEKCLQLSPVATKGEQVTGKDGKPLWTVLDAKNAIRALELLGKNLGLFTEKTEIKTDLGVTTLADLMMEEYGL